MIANKEKLEQLSRHIKRLTALTEEISERDIYPVSFFSQAYDITNTIQEELRQIEIAQIDLFEKQMKEHQAQILSIVPHSEQPEPRAETIPPATETPPLPKTEITPPPAQVEKPVDSPIHAGNPATSGVPVTEHPLQALFQKETAVYREVPPPASPSPEQTITKVFTNYAVSEIRRIDLKKVITLNDRFLFCRELFSNDENLMSRTIADLNKQESFEASMDYLKEHFDWNVEDEHVTDFIACLKKSFVN